MSKTHSLRSIKAKLIKQASNEIPQALCTCFITLEGKESPIPSFVPTLDLIISHESMAPSPCRLLLPHPPRPPRAAKMAEAADHQREAQGRDRGAGESRGESAPVTREARPDPLPDELSVLEQRGDGRSSGRGQEGDDRSS